MHAIERRFTAQQGELRFEQGEGRTTLAGYAAVFDAPADFGAPYTEVVRPGAFASSLTGERSIIALWNHNSDVVLGSTRSGSLRLREDERGLAFELDVPPAGFEREVGAIRRGDVAGVSFGFRVVREEFHEKAGPDGVEMLRELLEVELREISPTPFPAYPQTEVVARSAHRAAMQLRDPAAFSEVISRLGLTEAEVRGMNLAAIPRQPMPSGIEARVAATRLRALTAPRA